ncbi:hypothetical protein [Chachezhania sediminis]|uniref:hypothetical protein n=1 Tax=Chachezhania sediminis TaxID=2599291 RepID=UPI00131E5A4A|nr:hypothetical protein [Chachezhania sediminis]
MKPDFALSLSVEGIALLHRAPDGWRTAGEVPLDAPDLGAALAGLRDTALKLSPQGFATKVVIPNEQIRYLSIETGTVPDQDRLMMGAAALDGATPYPVEELAYDIAADGALTHVAAVALETLEEAETFAVEHDFNPVSFVAMPNGSGYTGEPFFGLTGRASSWSGTAAVEPDAEPIHVVGPAKMPAPAAAAELPAPETAVTKAPAPEAPKAKAPDPEKPKAEAPPKAAPGQQDLFDLEPVAATPAKTPKAEARPAPAPRKPASPAPPLAAPVSPPGASAGVSAGASARRAQPPSQPEPAPDPAPAFASRRPNGSAPAAKAAEAKTPPAKPEPKPAKKPAAAAQAPAAAADTAPEAEQDDTGPLTGFSSRRHRVDPARSEPAAPDDAKGKGPDVAKRPAPAVGPAGAPATATRVAGPTAAGFADTQTAAKGSAPRPVPPPEPLPAAHRDEVPDTPASKTGQASAGAFLSRRDGTTGTAEQGSKPSPLPNGDATEKTGSSVLDSLRGLAGTALSALDDAREKRRAARDDAKTGTGNAIKPQALTKADFKAAAKARKTAEAPAVKPPPGLGGGFPTGPIAQKTIVAPSKGEAAKAGTSRTATPEDDEAVRMTIFGARDNAQTRGKPKHLLLILMVGLLLVLAAIALWTTTFTEGGLSGLLRRDAGRIEQVEIAPEATPDDAVARVEAAPPMTEVVATVASQPEDASFGSPEEDTGAELPALTDDGSVVTDPVAAAEAIPDEPAGRDRGDAEAAALYAATGIWPGPPRVPQVVPRIGLNDVHVAGIDRTDLSHPVAPLPAMPGARTDLPLERLAALDPEEQPVTRTRTDALLSSTDLGTGAAARTAIDTAPETRAEPEAEATELAALDDQLIMLRPRLRPGDRLPELEAAPEVEEEPAFAGLRPRVRPEVPAEVLSAPAAEEATATEQAEAAPDPKPEVETPDLSSATRQAVALSMMPKTRPERLAQQAEARAVERANAEAAAAAAAASAAAAAVTSARSATPDAAEAEDEPEPERVASIAPATVSPGIPSTASLARRATLNNQINLRKINLIGVYGTPKNRRALVRLQNGRYKKVQVGDRIDGGQIVAISDSELRYQKGGRNISLKIPSS